MSEAHKNFKPFLWHGVYLENLDEDQAVGICPFCGEDGKFTVERETSKFRCWKCQKMGNSQSFQRMFYEECCRVDEIEMEQLREDRGLLHLHTLIEWGVRVSPLRGDIVVPGYAADGRIMTLYRYVPNDQGKYYLAATPGLGTHLFGVNLWVPERENVHICYSADTEVLTDRGWLLFKDLTLEDKVAAYSSLSQMITFERPSAKQVLDYTGPMIHFHSRWSRLLVTPDHRVLWRAPGCRIRTNQAKEIASKTQLQLPTSGYYSSTDGEEKLFESEIRLLVAFTADGCIRRGNQLEFRIKKKRKLERLKSLLEDANIPFSVSIFPGSTDHESVLIDRRLAPFFLDNCPDKVFTDDVLSWSVDARQILLDELKYWDGDAGAHSSRYFTSKAVEADLISRVAVLSGYSVQTETKHKENGSIEYVLCLMKKEWRTLANPSEEVAYSGKVYCATVSTGYLVVRRQGKVVISGNCEGAWDAMALWEVLKGSKRDERDTYCPTGSVSASLLAELDTNVISVPGCMVFDEKWAPLFLGKNLNFLYDSDHPKPNKQRPGEWHPPAGLAGMKKAVEAIGLKFGEKPKSVHVIHWGDDGYDKDLPSGYDIRDFLKGTEQTTVESRAAELMPFLIDYIRPVPEDWTGVSAVGEDGEQKVGLDFLDCTSWQDLLDSWKRALKWHDGIEHTLAAMLATCASTPFIGDQLWLKVVGPPASGKSTLAEAMAVNSRFVRPQSGLTQFHSGYKTDSDGKEDHSLIAKMEGKTLIIKDGDTLLQSKNLGVVFAQARDLYDRKSRNHYGNQVERNYNNLSVTVILCGTETLVAIDHSELGERFITICILGDDFDVQKQKSIMADALDDADNAMDIVVADNHGESQASPNLVEAMRKTAGYINHLRDNSKEISCLSKLLPEEKVIIGKYAEFISYMRARPSHAQTENYTKELPTRLGKQLVRLARSLCIVTGQPSANEHVMRTVLKCVRDTSRGKVLRIAEYLYVCGEDGADVVAISLNTHHPQTEDRGLLLFLRKLGAVENFQAVLKDKAGKIALDASGKPQKATKIRWRLTPSLRELYRLAMTDDTAL